jgi:glutamine amidotransferase
MIHPIVDDFYSHSPYHSRSSEFAVEKGLVTNATPRAHTPLPSSNPSEELKKQLPTSKLPESLFRSLASEIHTPSPLASPPIRILTSDTISSSKPWPDNNTPPTDIRRVKTIPCRDPARPQEQGNTKKKRRSLAHVEAEPMVRPEPEQMDGAGSSTSEERTSYGDPAKLAQYFPELNFS